MTVDEINAFDQDHFVSALGGLFEGAPWIVSAAWNSRPFASRDQLYDVLCRILYAATVERQIALIQAHPDLAGKAATSGTLGAASTSEQAASGLNRLSAEELRLFGDLNVAYREKFGFPFVICARQHTKSEILQAFQQRLTHTTEQEVRTALDEVCEICKLRLNDVCRAG
jgi:2-oxo-4-hydroxy-4-carboxy-5-ureidoimidazoline decarboxylase